MSRAPRQPPTKVELVPKDTYVRFREFATREFATDRKELAEGGAGRELAASEELAKLQTTIPTLTEAQFEARYKFVRSLARGGFGRVDVYLDRNLGNKPVAVKTMVGAKFDQLVENTKLEYTLNRIYALAFPEDDGVARCIDLFVLEPRRRLVMVQELACCGNLQEFIGREKARLGYIKTAQLKVTNRFLWTVAFQALKTLHLMHSIGMLHNDIKPANMVWNPDTWHLTLVDLGIACLTRERIRQVLDATKVKRVTPGVVCEDRRQIGGTLVFMPPEYLDQTRPTRLDLDPSRDVFALGISLYMIGAFGASPYSPGTRYIEWAKMGLKSAMPFQPSPHLSRAMNSFCAQLAAWNPKDRPTVPEALQICIENIDLFLKEDQQ